MAGYPGTASSYHFGRDYPAVFEDVCAPADAVVVAVEEGPHGVANVLDGAWGLYVRLCFDDGRVLDFCHLSKAIVRPGDRVRRGETIAVSGESGIAGKTVFGPHLHEQGWNSMADVGNGSKRVDTGPWYE